MCLRWTLAGSAPTCPKRALYLVDMEETKRPSPDGISPAARTRFHGPRQKNNRNYSFQQLYRSNNVETSKLGKGVSFRLSFFRTWTMISQNKGDNIRCAFIIVYRLIQFTQLIANMIKELHCFYPSTPFFSLGRVCYAIKIHISISSFMRVSAFKVFHELFKS